MTETDFENDLANQVAVALTVEMREQLEWLAERRQVSVADLALELFKDELEAQFGMASGSFRRKHLYRA